MVYFYFPFKPISKHTYLSHLQFLRSRTPEELCPFLLSCFDGSFRRIERSLLWYPINEVPWCPISWWTWTIFCSSNNDLWVSFFDVLEGCIADVHNLSSGNVSCLRAYLRSELVNDSSISKGSSSHDFIITSSCSISVKICRLNISLTKETGSRNS